MSMSSFKPTANKPYGPVHVSPDEHKVDEQARKRLLELTDRDAVVFLSFLNGKERSIEARRIARTLALTNRELCLEIAHESSTEYIWINRSFDGLISRARTDDYREREPIALSLDDLQNRVDSGKPITVRLASDVDLVTLDTEVDE